MTYRLGGDRSILLSYSPKKGTPMITGFANLVLALCDRPVHNKVSQKCTD
jgi:hypothetical protein